MSVAVASDLIQAKQVLSARLLRAGFRAGVVTRSWTLSVARAVAAAGRNVHAVGLGRKEVEGKRTETMAVRLHVVQKLAPSLIAPRDRLPETIDGVPTDVVESPLAFIAVRRRLTKKAKVAAAPAVAAPETSAAPVAAAVPACTDQRQANQRPVVAGISTAHHDVTAGTLGYFCRSMRQEDDPAQVCVLSNNHIYANLNRAQLGDPLYQPGPLDGGTAADHFADLARFVHLQLDGTSPNRVDAAIGNLLPNVPFNLEVCSIGKITRTTSAVEGMAVRKHGRTTGYAEGTVTDELIDAVVGMDFEDPNLVSLFQNQMRLAPTGPFPAIGLGGDSGSLVVDQSTTEAVGLYFANPPSGEYGYANRIADVLAELQIELL